MLDRNESRSAVIAAALTASLLLGVSGSIYRALAAPVVRTPLDPNVLAGFPMRIGEWTGQEVPLDPAVKKEIDADAYVSRRYVRQDGHEGIALYLPCGTDVQALLQHVPENCYVGGGWALVDRRPMELPLASGQILPCSLVQFARSGLDARKLLLLHFLVVDGEYFTTFSAVAKARGWHHFADVRYAAQVQIVTSADGVPFDAATKRVTDFAHAAAPAIEQFFRNVAVAWAAGASEVDQGSVP